MRVLDLFSGIGGFSLGLEWAGMETVGFCEQDEYCKKVLRRHWPDVPIHNDIKELNGNEYRGSVELVCGGFPCQPFSVAGQRRGEKDNRALWKEMYRVIREVQPAWVIGENVTGIISMELDNVLLDLEDEGYSTQAFVIPACALDARHRRDRVFILAHKKGRGDVEYTPEFGLEEHGHGESGQPVEGGEDVGNAEHDGPSAAEISRGDGKTFESSKTKGTKKTRESQRASGPEHHQNVAHSSGQSGRGGAVHTRPEDKGRKTRAAGGKSVQPKNGKSQPDHAESGGTSVADPDSEWQQQSKRFKQDKRGRSINSRKEESETVAHSKRKRQQGSRKSFKPISQEKNGKREAVGVEYGRERSIWSPEPDVGRVAHGIPNRVDRLKGLGNAVVPQVVELIGRAIVQQHFYEDFEDDIPF